MRSRRYRLTAVVLGVLLALTGIALGYNLTLPGGRRHASASVALVARALPRANGYRVTKCRPVAGNWLRCQYQVFIRALSGGTIICTARVQVRAAVLPVRRRGKLVRRTSLLSGFPGRPRCARERPGLARGGRGGQ